MINIKQQGKWLVDRLLEARIRRSDGYISRGHGLVNQLVPKEFIFENRFLLRYTTLLHQDMKKGRS
jgi:hypothetical protein